MLGLKNMKSGSSSSGKKKRSKRNWHK
jgi:hypothetical protein